MFKNRKNRFGCGKKYLKMSPSCGTRFFGPMKLGWTWEENEGKGNVWRRKITANPKQNKQRLKMAAVEGWQRICWEETQTHVLTSGSRLQAAIDYKRFSSKKNWSYLQARQFVQKSLKMKVLCIIW